MSLLEVEELRTGYGALPVLQGISFSVEEGETAVLFGLNGAGKTTTVNAIAGLLPAWSGQVRLDGKVISGLEPPKVVAAGVGLSPEGRRVFPQLTVLTNLRLEPESVTATAAPEPAALARVATGLLGVLGAARRRRAVS